MGFASSLFNCGFSFDCVWCLVGLRGGWLAWCGLGFAGFGFDVRWILCFVLVLGIVWLVSVLGCGGSFTVGWLLAVSIGGACWICCWVV